MTNEKLLYHNTLKWKGEKKADLRFHESGQEIEVAIPPEFGGHEGIISPEDLFVSSANVCIMTTFLVMMEKMGIKLVSYESEAEGFLESVNNKRVFTKIILKPRIRAKENKGKIREIIERAQERSLIVNSMKTEVFIIPEIEV